MKRIIRRISLLFFLFFILLSGAFVIIDKYVSSQGEKYLIDLDTTLHADAVIVLGAKVYDSGSPSMILQDRLNMGIAVYNEGMVDKILVTGDHGRKEYDEVNSMRAYIQDKGITEDDIFMDHAGFSTYESMYRAKEIFCVERVIIVTQEYHLKRALYIARTLGIEAYGVSSDTHVYPGMDYYELREKAARVKDYFKVKLKIEPTYLGETIPIWGSGVMTQDE